MYQSEMSGKQMCYSDGETDLLQRRQRKEEESNFQQLYTTQLNAELTLTDSL